MIIGHYLNVDDAVCKYCVSDVPEDAAVITTEDECDCPVHCSGCGELIPVSLTHDGVEYVMSAMTAWLGRRDGTASVVKAWYYQYRDYYEPWQFSDAFGEAMMEA